MGKPMETEQRHREKAEWLWQEVVHEGYTRHGGEELIAEALRAAEAEGERRGYECGYKLGYEAAQAEKDYDPGYMSKEE